MTQVTLPALAESQPFSADPARAHVRCAVPVSLAADVRAQHGVLRPLGAAELSDGTLRYLLWVAALLTPRPPGLLVLNEPETSLHPDLLPALGRLITSAAKRSQVLVVSHAPPLIDVLQQLPECNSIMLTKSFGETAMAGPPEVPTWHWPAR